VTAHPKSAAHGEVVTAAILRQLRRSPNRDVPLDDLAGELHLEPEAVQLAVERLHRRRLLIAPFIEPGRAGGARLTAAGLRWLVAREGGTPRDVPIAFQPARGRVRAADEAARLPRADVYGRRS